MNHLAALCEVGLDERLWALPMARWLSLSAAAVFALLHIQAGFQITEIYTNALQNTHRLLKPLILDIKQHPGERYYFVAGDLGQIINWPYEIQYYLTNLIGRNSNIVVSGVAFSQRDSYNWKSFDIQRDAGLWKISIPNPNASIDTQLVRISKERFVRVEKCIPGQGKEFFSQIEFRLYNLEDGSRLFYTDGPQLFIGEYRTTEGFHRAGF
jgi:hypothetical protein